MLNYRNLLTPNEFYIMLAVVLAVRNKQIIVRDLMHSKEKDSNEGKPLLKVQEMESLQYLQRASTTEFFGNRWDYYCEVGAGFFIDFDRFVY